jgi:prepilin-type N-terminal cleavage/methylation domain-containing protein
MDRKGVTLIELVIALGISSILIAGLYRVFISQQRIYTGQEQVADMQQNVRVAINQMQREIRMAGFGNVSNLFKAPLDGWHGYKWIESAKALTHLVTPGNSISEISLLGAYDQLTSLVAVDMSDTNHPKVYLDSVAYADGTRFFDENVADKGKQYICFNGTEVSRIKQISAYDNVIKGFPVELDTPLIEYHKAGEPVFRITAITYTLAADSDGKQCLKRNTNIGGNAQPVAVNIEELQFRYVLKNDPVPSNPTLYEYNDAALVGRFDDIRVINVRIVAMTDPDLPDPDLAKVSDGHRRRQMNFNIQLRNVTF